MQGTQTALLPIDREVFELTLNIFLQLLTNSGYLCAALASQVMAKKSEKSQRKLEFQGEESKKWGKIFSAKMGSESQKKKYAEYSNRVFFV